MGGFHCSQGFINKMGPATLSLQAPFHRQDGGSRNKKIRIANQHSSDEMEAGTEQLGDMNCDEFVKNILRKYFANQQIIFIIFRNILKLL